MTPEEIATLCAALPGATLDHPFGPGADVWKVGGKIFAIVSAPETRVSVKCADPEFAGMLIETGQATRAPYLPRGGWIAISIDGAPDDLAHRLRESHATVRASLPKRLRDTLG